MRLIFLFALLLATAAGDELQAPVQHTNIVLVGATGNLVSAKAAELLRLALFSMNLTQLTSWLILLLPARLRSTCGKRSCSSMPAKDLRTPWHSGVAVVQIPPQAPLHWML